MTQQAQETRGSRTGRITARAAALIAWLLWILILGFYVITFEPIGSDWYVLADPRLWSVEEIGGILVWNILGPAAPLAYATLGAVVVSLQPKNRIGWLCFVPGLVVVLLEGIAQLLANRLNVTFLMDWQSNSSFGVLLVGLLPVTLVLLIFPTGRLPSPRWRFAPWLAFGSTSLAVLADSLEGIYFSVSVAEALGLLASLIAFLISVTAVVLRWHRSRSQERQQIKWLAYTVAITVAAGVSAVASWYIQNYYALGDTSYLTIFASVFALAGVTVGIPVAIGIAILKHRLYDIDRIINRTLVYGVLTGILALIYLGGVVALQSLFRSLTEQGSQLAVVASTLVMAALFTPLRRRIQFFIDRRFYRRKYDARKTLEAFSAKLRNETDLDALSDDLTSVVREAMQPAHVSLWLRSDPGRKGRDGAPGKPSG